MRSDLIKIKCKDKAEWLAYQNKRTGGSTASALLGLNEYASAAEVFYRYIGVMPQKQKDSAPMYWGRALEPIVRDNYQYWAGDFDSMAANRAADNIVNQVAYEDDLTILVNPDYPFAHANIDGHTIQNYQGREGILEIKTIASYAADKYEAGFPVSYVCQTQLYMAVCELDFAEIAILKDGREFDVIPIERNDGIIDTILTKTKEFWLRVEEAKKVMASDLSQERKLAEVAQYEPPVENTKAYESFLKERFKANPDSPSIEGTQEHWDLCMRFNEIKPQIAALEDEQRGYKNKLIRLFEEREVIDFGEAGTVTYRGNKNGVRTLRINLR